MRRETITIITVLAGILLILILFIVFFNEAILRYNFPVWSKSVVQLVNQPKDFSDPLVMEELDILDGHAKQNIIIKHKYMGLYVVGLFFPKFDSALYRKYNGADRVSLSGNIKCYVGREVRSSQSISASTVSPFLGKTGGGFHLTHYKVPKDLPLGEIINCEFSVSNLEMELVKKYGPVKFFIRQLSDL